MLEKCRRTEAESSRVAPSYFIYSHFMQFYNLTLHGVVYVQVIHKRGLIAAGATDMSTDIHINLWGAIIDNDNGFHKIFCRFLFWESRIRFAWTSMKTAHKSIFISIVLVTNKKAIAVHIWMWTKSHLL